MLKMSVRITRMIIFFWPETSQGSANVTLKEKEYEMKTRRSALINIESGFNNDVSGLVDQRV